MGIKIITIGRQFGSGGHEIAIRTGEKLGLPVYEKELLRLACNYGEVRPSTLEQADEKPTNPFLFTAVQEGNYHVTRGLPTGEVLFQLQSHEIRRIAKKESCIFVGRCADTVLEGKNVNMLRVFVRADPEFRLERKMEQEHLSRAAARKLLVRMDKQRNDYYKAYTHKVWGDPLNYDLVLDTGKLGMDEAVDRLCALYLTI